MKEEDLGRGEKVRFFLFELFKEDGKKPMDIVQTLYDEGTKVGMQTRPHPLKNLWKLQK